MMQNHKLAGLKRLRWMAWGLPWVVMLIVNNCATVPSDGRPSKWTCDPQVDAAVKLEQWQHAIEGHERLLQKDPANCLAMYHLGYIWGKQGDATNEVAYYEKAIACGFNQNDELHFNLGMAYLDMHQLSNALNAFNNAIQANPENSDGYFGIGMVARTAGEDHTAEKAFIEAVAISPQHWDARLLLVQLYLDQGRLDEAQSHLATMMDHIPDNEDAQRLWRIYKDRRVTAYDR